MWDSSKNSYKNLTLLIKVSLLQQEWDSCKHTYKSLTLVTSCYTSFTLLRTCHKRLTRVRHLLQHSHFCENLWHESHVFLKKSLTLVATCYASFARVRTCHKRFTLTRKGTCDKREGTTLIVYIFAYLCVRVHVLVSEHTCHFIYKYTCICEFIYTWNQRSTIYVYIYIYMYLNLHVHVYLCMGRRVGSLAIRWASSYIYANFDNQDESPGCADHTHI